MTSVSTNNQNLLIDCLIGCAIGDAVGAGHEMRSREQLLSTINDIKSRYHSRDPKFSKGFTPGDYTDDFEMTLAVLFALKECNWNLTEEALYKYYYELYPEVFIIYTDNDVNAGIRHPCQALVEYRALTGIPAKMAVVATQSSKVTIADPKDAGMMDFVGFDT